MTEAQALPRLATRRGPERPLGAADGRPCAAGRPGGARAGCFLVRGRRVHERRPAARRLRQCGGRATTARPISSSAPGRRSGPGCPAPHQIAQELGKTVFGMPVVVQAEPRVPRARDASRRRSLGFVIGSLFGIGLSLLVVHVRSLDRGMMPWIVASQTIPVVALAPMIVVILNQFSVTGLLPKALIAAYLSFFPVTVGMVKGLRSPDPLQFDLMRTYSASAAPGADQAAPAGEPAVPVRQPQGRGRGEPRRHHRGRGHEERGRRTRGAPAGRLLLRADHPDLGGACSRRPFAGPRWWDWSGLPSVHCSRAGGPGEAPLAALARRGGPRPFG